jgi:DNA polymerase II small subunit/DNA polymerase delta subunit B
MKYDGVLNIYIIPGNHDYNRIGVHSMKLLELLCVKNKFETVHLYVTPTKVTIDGEKFNFVPFPYTNGIAGYINGAQ